MYGVLKLGALRSSRAFQLEILDQKLEALELKMKEIREMKKRINSFQESIRANRC